MMRFYLTTILILVFTACGTDEPTVDSIVVPTNLVVSIENLNDGSGTINVTAEADNAYYFDFYFGEESNEPIRNENGLISYSYKETGEYLVEVRALGNSSEYISYNETIQIYVDGSFFIPQTGFTTPETYAGMQLVWRDEFDQQSLNTNDWTYEIGDGCPNICGWGNNELQYYTNENTALVEGNLVIEAKKESRGNRQYTSSRIITKNNQSFQYGRVDIRANLPKGQGIWPALWMLGDNIDQVGWPACGEIDIMELIGGSGNGRDNTVHGTVHWRDDATGDRAQFGGDYTLPNGIFNDQFHVFSIVWTQNRIEWLVDDVRYHAIDTSPAGLSEFRNSFFFIFNIAVGGNWPGNPDGSTVFPQRMIVDYIRVFQEI